MTEKDSSITFVVAGNIRHYMEVVVVKFDSTDALAKSAGVSQKTVWNFLNPGKRNQGARGEIASGTLANLEKIAGALKVEPWQLTQSRSAAERQAYEKIEQAYRILHDDKPTPEDLPSPADREIARLNQSKLPKDKNDPMREERNDRA